MTRPTCSVAGCDKTINARALCHKHYRRFMRYGDVHATRDARSMTTEEYFAWRTKENSDGCLIWTGKPNAQGYGTASRGSKKMLAHRFSYASFVGPIPAGEDVRHKCDVRLCVNPSHLEPGTRAENNKDTSLRNRHGNAKLSNDDVMNIRWAHGLGASGSSLARAYGVTPTLISQIVNRRARRNV